MNSNRFIKLQHSTLRKCFFSSNKKPIGFIGLGQMGSKMATNFVLDGHSILAYDRSDEAVSNLIANDPNSVKKGSLSDIAQQSSIVFSMLPNDDIVYDISQQLFDSNNGNKFLHVSCSTISPNMAKKLLDLHINNKAEYVSSPVFARPDGILRREATFMISGAPESKEVAIKYLNLLGKVEDFGEDIGAANVVKLCGNFLISSSIEAIGESMALAEKNGVDRLKVMNLLSSTIFNCLIYKGYGQRVSERDHRPGGFSLELGYKDVSLVQKAARDANVPMPFLSTLVDRYTSAKAKDRQSLDWSAIGLNIAEDAGIDISSDLKRNLDLVAKEKQNKK